jgi:hypothetical protein
VIRAGGRCGSAPPGAIQGGSTRRRIAGPHTLPVFVEGSHHVLRKLPEARVNRLRAGLREHVPHAPDQDKLRLITRGFEVPVEFNRLRLKDFCVVDTLHNENRRRVRGNEMRGASKNQIPAITFAEDLLNAGGREPRCSLSEVRGAKHICYGTQVARFRRIRSDVPGRVPSGEGSERDKLPADTGAEREYLTCVQAVPRCLGPQIPDCALYVLDLGGKPGPRSKPVVHAGDRVTGRSQCVKENRVEVRLVACGHTSPVDVHCDGKRASDSAARDIQIQTLRITVSQISVGSTKRKRHIGWCRAAPSHQPCQQQPGRKEPSPDHIYQSWVGRRVSLGPLVTDSAYLAEPARGPVHPPASAARIRGLPSQAGRAGRRQARLLIAFLAPQLLRVTAWVAVHALHGAAEVAVLPVWIVFMVAVVVFAPGLMRTILPSKRVDPGLPIATCSGHDRSRPRVLLR